MSRLRALRRLVSIVEGRWRPTFADVLLCWKAEAELPTDAELRQQVLQLELDLADLAVRSMGDPDAAGRPWFGTWSDEQRQEALDELRRRVLHYRLVARAVAGDPEAISDLVAWRRQRSA